MENQVSLFMDSLRTLWTQLASYVPQLLAAVVLLFAGWIIAKVARNAFSKALLLAKFDQLGQKTGIEVFLRQGGIQCTLVELLSWLIYWGILMVVVVTVANSLGLAAVAELFNRVVFYLPNVLVAILIVVFGSLMAKFLNKLVYAYLNNLSVYGAPTLSNVVEYVTMIFVILVALEQLQISTHLLLAAFQIGFGAIAFALAIAFGLGGKEWAASYIKRLTDKNR